MTENTLQNIRTKFATYLCLYHLGSRIDLLYQAIEQLKESIILTKDYIICKSFDINLGKNQYKSFISKKEIYTFEELSKIYD
jgi:hypothetical protein